MDPMIIGALIGLAQSAEQQGQDSRNRKMEAVKAQWSPWTGMKPDNVQSHSALGPVVAGVASGAAQNQQTQAQQDFKNYLDKMLMMQGQHVDGGQGVNGAISPYPYMSQRA